MATFDGETILDTNRSFFGNSLVDFPFDGETILDTNRSFFGNSLVDFPSSGYYSQTDSRPIITTTYYFKRGRPSPATPYVEWIATSPSAPYPGEGTTDPVTGVVIFSWTITS